MTRPIDARVVAAVFVPPLLVLFFLAVIAVARELDTGAIFRDPTTLLEGYPLLGAMSNVGVVLWWLAAGTCLFTWWLSGPLGLDRGVGVFLLTAGLLTTLLAIDDQFLLHDELVPLYLGLRERYVMAGYLLLVGAWLLLNLRVIRRSEWPLLAGALAFFGGSVATDVVAQATMTDVENLGRGLDWVMFAEDGLKFVGIFGWAAYFFRFCHGTVVERVERA